MDGYQVEQQARKILQSPKSEKVRIVFKKNIDQSCSPGNCDLRFDPARKQLEEIDWLDVECRAIARELEPPRDVPEKNLIGYESS